ncbi:MAG: enoyl-CoA hydratase/isomerase family protein [Chloroflexi bacterium]|nr:enoyl-CoA hydratase/isomerase family protein [Chloroflexota bacterium]MYJ57888.1 enoyl-CoA hydratase/isomerase family protein [Chloroflexota bacterium]
MDEIGYTVDGHIASVQLLRPEKLNAMTDEMYHAIGDAFKQADADPQVRCVVISGSGRAFTSGHDLLEFGERQAWKPWSAERFDNGLETAKPVIAAINGYCLAGGLELALYCDIRICDTTAQFGCPEPRWGILHGYGALRTPGLVGTSDAMRLLLTGEFIDAEEALRIGLVSQVVEPADLISTANEMAAKIAVNSPLAIRLTKELARRGRDMSLADGLRLYQEYSRLAFSSDDAREGTRAFAERRDPQYQG